MVNLVCIYNDRHLLHANFSKYLDLSMGVPLAPKVPTVHISMHKTQQINCQL